MATAALEFRTGMPWDRTLTDEQMAAIAAPLLVLLGAETVVNDPEREAARVRKLIPTADVEIYPGGGHDLLWVNPEQIVPRFLAFLDENDSVRT